LPEELDKLHDLFKELPVIIEYDNRVGIMHTGLSSKYKTWEQICSSTNIDDFMWNRDISTDEIIGIDRIIHGHTPVHKEKYTGSCLNIDGVRYIMVI
jgi:UDP-2,3-diacylglucosamine pyrophosphatase LpxH